MIIDRNPYVLALVVAGVCAMVPVLRPDDLTILGVGFLTFIFVTQAVSWNLVGGFAGQVSFGFAAFFGTGAYVTAILWSRYGWDPLLTLPFAGLAAMVIALLVGLPCFRLSGPYFSIATIGVGEAARVIAINLDNITGGASGLVLPFTVPEKSWFYRAGLILATVTFLCAVWIRRHRFGLALFSLRMDQTAAESLGVPTALFKNLAHMVAAFFVGVSAGLYVVYLSYAHPDQVFGFDLSIGMVLMNVIGGIGTLWGPVLGAVILEPAQLWLAYNYGASRLYLVLYSAVFLLVILFMPRGIIPSVSELIAKRRASVPVARAGAAP